MNSKINQNLVESYNSGIYEGFPLKQAYERQRSNGKYNKIKNESYLHYFFKMVLFINIRKTSIFALLESPVYLESIFESEPMFYVDIGIPFSLVYGTYESGGIAIELWTSKKMANKKRNKNRHSILTALGWKVIDVYLESFNINQIINEINELRKLKERGEFPMKRVLSAKEKEIFNQIREGRKTKINILCKDKNGNIVNDGDAEFRVYWGNISAVVPANDHDEAACKLIASFADTKEPLPRHKFIRVKPKGRGGRDPDQELIYDVNWLYNMVKEKYGIVIHEKPDLRLVHCQGN